MNKVWKTKDGATATLDKEEVVTITGYPCSDITMWIGQFKVLNAKLGNPFVEVQPPDPWEARASKIADELWSIVYDRDKWVSHIAAALKQVADETRSEPSIAAPTLSKRDAENNARGHAAGRAEMAAELRAAGCNRYAWVDQTSRDVAGLFIPLTAFPDPK